MPGIDDLAPDQRAVLQLVLGQGRDFDQLAGLLKISPHAVRDRATTGAETLVPPPPGLNASERDAIVAYLLGEGSAPRDLSPAGQAWGADVRRRLAPVAAAELPAIPGDEPGPAAAPPAETAAAGPAESAAAPAATTASGERPPRSLVGGAVLIGVVAIVVVVLLIKLVGGSGGGSSSSTSAAKTSTAKTTASTPTTGKTGAAANQNGPQIRAQVNLRSPSGAKGTQGIAQLVTQKGAAGFAVTVQGVATQPRSYTGVWLTGSSTKPVMIAAVTNDQIRQGRFAGLARVPSRLARFNAMVLSREALTKARRPPAAPSSAVIMRGALKVPAAFGS